MDESWPVKKSVGFILRKIFAFLIDILIFFPIYGFFFLMLFTTPVPEHERTVSIIFAFSSFFAIVIISIMYFIYLEYRYGKTLGKWLFHIKVESLTGTKTFLQISVRNVLLPVDVLVGIFLIIFQRDSRRLGDIAAGTVVVSG